MKLEECGKTKTFPQKQGVDILKKLVIKGGNKLTGTIKIGGAKNSVVALLPAAILSNSNCTIKNVPNISDVHKLNEMLEILGAKVEYEKGIIKLDTKNIENKEIDEYHANSIRASYYFMGALLGKYHKAEISMPGGCVIGSRPIDLHIKAFEKLGAKVKLKDNKYTITAKKLVGADIYLDFASVGATVNTMLAAVLAEGITKIFNAAKEPEIENVADFLKSMGAKICGVGTSTIIIEGVKELTSGNIEVIPDRIETGTYLMIGMLLGKNLVIEGVSLKNLDAVISKLKETGARFKIDHNKIYVTATRKLKPVNVKTEVYPGFPTDLGQPMSTLLTQCKGESLFQETIYENRMRHIPHLNEMGANIKTFDNNAVIKGKTKLRGREVIATDLRAGAAMMVAGMIAKGTTTITNIEHILRGYENIVDKLSNVGADIKLIEED